MISINATLVLQVVHLLILILILNRLLFRPIQKVINERTAFIDGSKTRMREIERETERLKNEYLSMEKTTRKDASRESQKLKSMGISRVEELIEDSQKEVESIRSESERVAIREIETARPLLKDEAFGLSEEIIERVIGRRIVH